MESCFLARLVAGFAMVVISTADPQAQFQLRRLALRPVNGQIRNFIPSRFGGQKGGQYPPVPPDSRREQLPGYSRNFIPNRFDISASIINRKPGSKGCVGPPDPCALVSPMPAPALPMPLAYPAPAAFTGYPQGISSHPYNSQGYPVAPMAPNVNALAQNNGAAIAAKAKLLGGFKPGKKFVPHLPPMGRPQKGKPPYNPPPPQPKPLAGGYLPAAGQMPYQQPLSYNPQGMVSPQPAGFGPQPAGAFAPPAFTAPQAPVPFAPPLPQPAFNQVPVPMGGPQQDEPQFAPNSNAPQAPPPQVSFSPEVNQGPAFPGQQTSDGSFDIARKRMMALRTKGQVKRFGVPRPVLRSRLVPKPLYKRHS